MRIFFADGSRFGNGRLTNLLADMKDVEIVGSAFDGITAQASIEQLKPEVVILDIEMPGRSGLDLLRSIKRMDPPITVIVLTNASHPQYRKRCAEEGADFFFDKSREFRKVPDVLKRLSGKTKSGRQQSTKQ